MDRNEYFMALIETIHEFPAEMAKQKKQPKLSEATKAFIANTYESTKLINGLEKSPQYKAWGYFASVKNLEKFTKAVVINPETGGLVQGSVVEVNLGKAAQHVVWGQLRVATDEEIRAKEIQNRLNHEKVIQSERMGGLGIFDRVKEDAADVLQNIRRNSPDYADETSVGSKPVSSQK